MTPSRSPRRAPSRFGFVAKAALVAAALTMVVSSCSSSAPEVVTVTQTPGGTSSAAPVVTVPSQSDAATGSSTPPPSSTTQADQPRVTATPAFGSKNVGPNDPISLTAFHATLSSVTMSGSDGSVVAGDIADGKTWTATDTLKYGVTYTVSGESVATDGSTSPFEGTLTTANPQSTTQAAIQIPDGATVGIAAPIVLTFLKAVENKTGIKDRLHVTVNGEDIEGAWVWMADEDVQGNGTKWSRIHFRPKDFWPANAEVHVEADLYGVNYGSGWGRADLTRDFKIGPKLVVQADVDSFRMLVIKDDQVIRNYPVSYGKESIPGRNTVSGIHIVQDKEDKNPDGSFKMCNLAYGYCNVTEYWGVRINNNGEFIHVNKQTEAKGLLGKANVSHGCINMGMKDGKEFYDMVYYGVPVEVTNTGVKMSEKDYIWDWSKSWSEWKALSDRV